MSKNEQFLNKMSKNQREGEILSLLKEKRYMTVEELAAQLYSSPSSIRRDLSKLQQEGYLRRFHGGAELLSQPVSMSPFSIRNQTNRKEKMAIARNAAALIEADTSIFIDSSSTAMYFSQFLHQKLNITIYTNNMQLAYLLVQQKIRTYLVGGLVSEFDPIITIGSYALEMLKQIYVDQMFFTSSALNEKGEIYDVNEEETAIRKLMLERTKEKIFLCSKERFGQISPHRVALLKDMDFLVFPLGYDIGIYFALLLEERYGQKLPDAEISLIAVHFYSSLLEENNKTGTKRVLVISSLKNSMTLLLRQTLLKWFPRNISRELKVCSTNKQVNFILFSWDLPAGNYFCYG